MKLNWAYATKLSNAKKSISLNFEYNFKHYKKFIELYLIQKITPFILQLFNKEKLIYAKLDKWIDEILFGTSIGEILIPFFRPLFAVHKNQYM